MKAHASTISRRGLASLLAVLAVHALPAGALGLGDLQVHSALGEPLDATIGLEVDRDAKPSPKCFSQTRVPGAGAPVLPRAAFTVESDAGAWRLRVRTRAAVREPASRLRIEVSCDGSRQAPRDYDVLLDPRPAEAPSPALRSLPGDTVASIALAIYPKRHAVREAYIRALQAGNPALAALSPDAPIPPGTEIALPDLRRFSLSLAMAPGAAHPAAPAAAERAAAPPPAARLDAPPKHAARPAPPPRPAPAIPAKQAPPVRVAKPAAAPAPAKREAAEPAPAEAAAPAPKPGAFRLRLSSPEIDLSRSRGIDERTRAQLREHLLVLDADDQVAALLSMRHSLKQLEGRVAELQLKLSTLPAARAAPAPATQASTPPPPELAPPQPEMPKPEAPKPAASEIPKPAATAASKPVPPQQDALRDKSGLPAWLWAALALAVAGAAALAWRLLLRRRHPAAVPAPEPEPAHSTDLDEAEAMMRPGEREAAAGHRVVASSDAQLSTSVGGTDATALRRRYIEERFPEIASGTIEPGEPDSVVKAARLFYEDGAIARAVELLQFAIEEDPAALKPWLALFEIFRLEGLTGEFAELAGRFQQHHGNDEYWRKVQFIGREIDPQNPLYREAAFNSLETIGYPAAKAAPAVAFDPLAENWLNAPMDFTTDALAATLRAGILADAGLRDTDLVADPMPALKNVEMFNVA